LLFSKKTDYSGIQAILVQLKLEILTSTLGAHTSIQPNIILNLYFKILLKDQSLKQKKLSNRYYIIRKRSNKKDYNILVK